MMTVYNIPDLVPILKMKKRAIRRLLTDRHLQGRLVGRQWLVTEEAVKAFLQSPDSLNRNRDRRQKFASA